MTTCNNCLQPVSTTAKFCENCGSTLQPNNRVNPISKLDSIMNPSRSLQWTPVLMKLGLAQITVQQRNAINTLIRNGDTPQPLLGVLQDEIEIGALVTTQEALWKSIIKVFAQDQTTIKTSYINAHKNNGDVFFGTQGGLMLFTNKRLLTYNFQPEWYWQTDGFNLENVEYDDKRFILRLFVQNGSYYEFGLSLPRSSIAGIFAIFDDNQSIGTASRMQAERRLQDASDARVIILSFFNELIHGAKQTRSISSTD